MKPDEGVLLKLKAQRRRIEVPRQEDPDLGPLKHLPGVWRSSGRGWNMIALPFADAVPPLNYRLLLNQYDEDLEFTLVDKAVPNRGINLTAQTDQFVVTLDYVQKIHQVAAVDFPDSKGLAGPPGLAIHHEPGLFLHMKNEVTGDLDVARLATIPHGDSVLALGTSDILAGLQAIPPIIGLPDGVSQNLNANPYLLPYKTFHDSPFMGTVVGVPGFPGFDPTNPTNLLTLANKKPDGSDIDDVKETTVLTFDSTHPTGGISNIPFVVAQANASTMKSTFWIQEMKAKDAYSEPTFRLQYAQIVMLDFFPRRDGFPGRIRWPHVSINTLDKDLEASKRIVRDK